MVSPMTETVEHTSEPPDNDQQLIFGIHLLTDRYAACRYNQRDEAEWPPEFARFYSALVDAWATNGEGAQEADALDWLATLGAPAIQATDAAHRKVRLHYVPVNDPILAGTHTDQAKTHTAWWALRLCRAVLDTDNQQDWFKLAQRASNDLSGPSSLFARQTLELVQSIVQREDAKSIVKLASRLKSKAEKEFAKQTANLVKKSASALRKNEPELLPEQRTRKERTFPLVIPHEPCFYYAWSDDWTPHAAEQLRHIDKHREALSALMGRVSRIGHSSTLVTCWLASPDAFAKPNWLPDANGGHILRSVGSGQRKRLSLAHARHQAVEPRVLPYRNTRYRTVEESLKNHQPISIHAGGWFIFERIKGPRLPIIRATDLAAALRGAILRHTPDPVPELLSGHLPDGRPAKRPHAAFIALPFVGRPHATGQLLGAAVVLPRGLPEEEAEPLLAAIGRWGRLHPDGAPLRIDAKNQWHVAYVPGLAERWALQETRWTGPACHWRSATPVALGRNPGKLTSPDPAKAEAAWKRAENCLRDDVRRAGLPAPLAVNLTFQPLVEGSRPAGAFGPFPRTQGEGKFRRVLVHAEVIFTSPIRGPLLLGAGRHLGLGLFTPIDRPEKQP